MNILITSAGKRVSLVKFFQKEIKAVRPESKVFVADLNPHLSAAAQISDGAFKVPPVNSSGYLSKITEICKTNNISLIIPTIDTELIVLAKNEQLLLNNGIKPVISSVSFINKCRDKRKIHEFFKAHNINVAKEFPKDRYKLPLFIKPVDGSRSTDTFIILKEDELVEYHFKNEKLMFLEYLDRDVYEEFTCDLYYSKDSKLKCVVPRKRIEVRDGEVNKGKTEKNILISYIKEKLYHIPGAKGCLTAQFFKHKENNHIIGIEINPRFGGGFPLSYLAGANYVRWIIEEYLLDKNIDECMDCWENNLLMLRYDNEILVHEYKS
ncbi:ATP-grasp domain-containing protein [Abyssalbus ytuae]|uniref:ATP-grasp domain-containing protein n=1 Tax=Abyssalbus ytuae TaxID=2926907 RepID=A0A9E6ZUN1_9FLAO|nr:ATP-grasp domain-containing protein [Abyssalbus ytuae]UOB17071.1 ATP-grasp domain-containing protein [Abyssalbus ytuae]